MKQCNRCNTTKPLSDFYKKPGAKDGLFGYCKRCHFLLDKKRVHEKRADRNAYMREYGSRVEVKIKRAANRVRTKTHRREVLRSWREQNKEHVVANDAARYLTRIKHVAALTKAWALANPGKRRAGAAKRRAALRNALPSWLTDSQFEELDYIYENCPLGFEVDHILPLQGKVICGLHVPWNLQYLTKTDNRSKGNKY